MLNGVKGFLVAGCLFMAVSGQAATLEEVFVRMPSDLLPILNQSSRRDLVDFYKNKQKAVVPSVFDYKVALTTLNDTYLMLQTSSASTLQLKTLSLADSTAVLVINTAFGPLPDSRARFYTKNWKPLTNVSMPVMFPRHFLDSTRLDAGMLARFDQICSPFFVQMDADPVSPVIHVRASFGEGVPEHLLAPYNGLYIDSLTLTWNGKGFQF